jgi:predicted metal-dependent TIM-barrel fold hydrolase
MFHASEVKNSLEESSLVLLGETGLHSHTKLDDKMANLQLHNNQTPLQCEGEIGLCA